MLLFILFLFLWYFYVFLLCEALCKLIRILFEAKLTIFRLPFSPAPSLLPSTGKQEAVPTMQHHHLARRSEACLLVKNTHSLPPSDPPSLHPPLISSPPPSPLFVLSLLWLVDRALGRPWEHSETRLLSERTGLGNWLSGWFTDWLTGWFCWMTDSGWLENQKTGRKKGKKHHSWNCKPISQNWLTITLPGQSPDRPALPTTSLSHQPWCHLLVVCGIAAPRDTVGLWRYWPNHPICIPGCYGNSWRRCWWVQQGAR